MTPTTKKWHEKVESAIWNKQWHVGTYNIDWKHQICKLIVRFEIETLVSQLCMTISDFGETKDKFDFLKPPRLVGIVKNAANVTRNVAITQIS